MWPASQNARRGRQKRIKKKYKKKGQTNTRRAHEDIKTQRMGLNLWAYAVGSTVLAVGVVVNALHTKEQFYPAALYLSKSKACSLVRRSHFELESRFWWPRLTIVHR